MEKTKNDLAIQPLIKVINENKELRDQAAEALRAIISTNKSGSGHETEQNYKFIGKTMIKQEQIDFSLSESSL